MIVKVNTAVQPVVLNAAPDISSLGNSDTKDVLTEQEFAYGQSISDFTDDAMEAILNDPETEMLYRDAKVVRDVINTNQINDRTVTQIERFLIEYLDSFILLGYDTHGRRIVVKHTPKQGDADALQKYVEHASNNNIVYATMAARQHQQDDDEDDD